MPTPAKDRHPKLEHYPLRVRKKHPLPKYRATKKRRNRNHTHAACQLGSVLLTLCGLELSVEAAQASEVQVPITCGHCLRVVAGQPRTYGVTSRHATTRDLPGVR